MTLDTDSRSNSHATLNKYYEEMKTERELNETFFGFYVPNHSDQINADEIIFAHDLQSLSEFRNTINNFW